MTTTVKKEYYRVDDDCEPIVVEGVDEALEMAKEMLYGMSPSGTVKITQLEMTEKQYKALPEL